MWFLIFVITISAMKDIIESKHYSTEKKIVNFFYKNSPLLTDFSSPSLAFLVVLFVFILSYAV